MLKRAAKLYKKHVKDLSPAILRQLEARQLALKYVANVTYGKCEVLMVAGHVTIRIFSSNARIHFCHIQRAVCLSVAGGYSSRFRPKNPKEGH